MLKLGSHFNGVQALNFFHRFRHLTLYSTSASTSSLVEANVNTGFANYLVDFLGFPKQQALSTSNKLTHKRMGQGAKKVSHFNFIQNADSVIQFLKHIGLDHSHIRNAVVRTPHILLCNVDKTLNPKPQAFLKLGFTVSDFIEIVKFNPFIFITGLNNVVVPAIQALRETLGCDSDVVSILKKYPNKSLYGFSRYLGPNVALLLNYGIPIESIRKHILWESSVCTRKPEILEKVVIRVEETLGIPRYSPQFLYGVRLLVSCNDKTIHSKREVFRNFGWTDADIAALTKKNPCSFGLSAATIKKKLGFFMTEMGYQPDFLISYYNLLAYSLEKRIVPRHKVILVLKEKGLISIDYSLQKAMIISESCFLEKFVQPFTEVHELYSRRTGLSMEVLTQSSLKKKSDPA